MKHILKILILFFLFSCNDTTKIKEDIENVTNIKLPKSIIIVKSNNPDEYEFFKFCFDSKDEKYICSEIRKQKIYKGNRKIDDVMSQDKPVLPAGFWIKNDRGYDFMRYLHKEKILATYDGTVDTILNVAIFHLEYGD